MPRSFKTTKQPNERFPYGFDFTTDLVTGETISSAVVTAIDKDSGDPADILEGGYEIGRVEGKKDFIADPTGPVIAQKINVGEDGKKYKVTVLITTGNDNNYESDLEIKIKAK